MNKEIENINKSIYEKIIQTSTTVDDGLLTGRTGLALYYAYYASVFNDMKSQELSIEILSSIFENINTKNTDLIGYNLSNGILGFALGLYIMNKDNLIDIDLNESLSEVDEYIFQSSFKEISEGKIDFLHQSLGAIFYFYLRNDNPKSIEYLNQYIDKFDSNAILDNLGLRFVNSSGPRAGNVYDLSTAHGLVGIILILLKIYNIGIKKDKIKFWIDQSVSFILNNVDKLKFENKETFIPLGIDIMKFEPFYSPMLAWCYGDLNYLYLFQMLKSYDFNYDNLDNIINVLTDIVCNRNIPDAKINDSHFCHGSSGVAVMFSQLYKVTGNKIYEVHAHKWIEFTNNFIRYELVKDHYSNRNQQLLEGLVGVGLSYLSFESKNKSTWKEIFLL